MSSWAGLQAASCPKSQLRESTVFNLEFREYFHTLAKVLFSSDTSGSRKLLYFHLGKVTCNHSFHFIENTALGSPEEKNQTNQSSLN